MSKLKYSISIELDGRVLASDSKEVNADILGIERMRENQMTHTIDSMTQRLVREAIANADKEPQELSSKATKGPVSTKRGKK